jgi:hypothetical protein
MTLVDHRPHDPAPAPIPWPPSEPLTRADTPSLTAWEMRDGAYAQVAEVTGDDPADLTRPYDVQVVPADLIL